MSCTVGGATNTQPASNVEEPKPTEQTEGSKESVKEAYDAGKESIKAMDDVLQQAEDAQPGDDPNIQQAREDLKAVDEAMDDVNTRTEELREAKEGGAGPEEIEEKFNAAIDSQMDFGEKYETMRASMEKAGFQIPPLEQ